VQAERPQVAWPGIAAAPQASGGGDQYSFSGHAESGGIAVTINTVGGPQQPAPAPKPEPPRPEKKITILFLAANPKNTDPLRLGEEVRTIDERLRLAQHRDRFNLEQQWAVRTGDILDAMLRYKPDIVHFSGHGDATGALIFEDASGVAKPVSAAALGALFDALEGVRCVVMNACWSSTHATQIAKHVDCVIGMSRAVSDEAAIGFARVLSQPGRPEERWKGVRAGQGADHARRRRRAADAAAESAAGSGPRERHVRLRGSEPRHATEKLPARILRPDTLSR